MRRMKKWRGTVSAEQFHLHVWEGDQFPDWIAHGEPVRVIIKYLGMYQEPKPRKLKARKGSRR
jgi:hypothetical protein